MCANTSDSHRVFTNVVRPVPEAPGYETRRQHSGDVGDTDAGVRARAQRKHPYALAGPCASNQELTDDHDGELDTLLDLVSPASAGERHGVKRRA